MRKTISSKLMALVITIMLIVASLPMSMVSASAATDNYKLTVTAKSNYFPEAVAEYNAETKQVIVSYYWKSSKDMLDCQYSFYYDSNVLTWSSKNTADAICPTIGTNGAYFNPNYKTDADGIVEGRYNATSLYLYDFSSKEKAFARFIFTVKDGLEGKINTAINLEMTTLRVSKVDSTTLMTDDAEEVELINFSEVIENEDTASVAVTKNTTLTKSTYVEPDASATIKFAAPTSSINRYNWSEPVLYYGNSSTYADNTTIAMTATTDKYYTAEVGISTILSAGAWTVYEAKLTEAQVEAINAAKFVGFATADGISRTSLYSSTNVLKANVDSYAATYGTTAKTVSDIDGATFVIADASGASSYTSYKGYWVTDSTVVKFAAPMSNNQRSTWDKVSLYYGNTGNYAECKTLGMVNTGETTKVSDIGDMETLKAGRWYIFAVSLNKAQVAEVNAAKKVGFAKPGDTNKTSYSKSVLLALTDEYTGTYNTTARTLEELEGQVFVPQAKSAPNQQLTFLGEWQTEAKYTEGKDDTITVYFASPRAKKSADLWDTGVELYYGNSTAYKNANRIVMTKTDKTYAASVTGTNLTTLKAGNWTVYSAELTPAQIMAIDASNNVGFIKAGSYNRTSILAKKNITRASRIEDVTDYSVTKETIEAFDGLTFVINGTLDVANERTSYVGSWVLA